MNLKKPLTVETICLDLKGADVAAFNKRVYDMLKPGGYFIVVDHVAAEGSGMEAPEGMVPAAKPAVAVRAPAPFTEAWFRLRDRQDSADEAQAPLPRGTLRR